MVKHITRAVVILLLVAVLGAMAVLVWFSQEKRSLEWARPTITRALNPAHAPYVVEYVDATIDWRDWSQFGLLHVKSVTIAGRDGTVFASFPDVYISFSPYGMLTGGRMLNTILLYKPKLTLARDAEKVFYVGLEGAHAIPVASLMGDSSSGQFTFSNSLPFKRLIIDRASLGFTDAVTNSTISSSKATLRFTRSGSKLEASVSVPFTYNKQSGSIDATLRSFDHDDAHVLNASLDRVPAELGCILVTCTDGIDAKGMISGKFSMGFDDEAKPTSLDVNLNANNAVFTAPKIFAEPLVVSRGLLQLKSSEVTRLVNLSRLSVVAEDTTFEVTGDGRRDEAGWHVNAKARAIKPIAVPKIYKYWPLSLAPDSRAWVLGAMKGGRAENLYLNLTLSPDDFKAEYVSDGAVDAGLVAKELVVDYLPGFPHMRNADAKAHFTGTTATVDVKSAATLSGTAVQHAVVLFPDLNKPGTPVEIVSTLRAPAADVATLLALKPFTFDDPVRLDPNSISGTIDAMLNLKFNAFSGDLNPGKPVSDEPDFSTVIYTISTQLQNVAQKKLAGKIDLAGLNGSLTASNAGMNFDGSLAFAGATSLGLKIAQTSGEDVSIKASGTVGREQLVQLGVPDGDYLGEGTAKVSTQLLAQKNGVLIQSADADFTDMALAIPELSWTKKRGVAAHASLGSDPTSGASEQRYTGKVMADDLKIPDLLLTLDANQQLKSLSVPSVVSNRNRFAVNYRARADGFDVNLTGKRLDMSDSFAKSGNGGGLKNFPPIGLTIDLGELVLASATPFTNVKGTLLCGTQRCDSATIRANIGKNSVNATITTKAGLRQLQILANNAGDFLRAVDFTDRMYNGTMEVKGNYDDSANPPIFAGNVNINDFTLKNSAILGRIFSIGSLTGLQNALTGSGIAFDKLTAEVGHQAGVITVNKGKANGNAMGITVGGNIDTNEAKINLKGVVVPAYAINSLIGKIPLIGAIAGGDGEGLIAFNYSVGGTYAKPDVSVNALSGLTPGFLRGIFGIFDSKEKKPVKPTTPNASGETP